MSLRWEASSASGQATSRRRRMEAFGLRTWSDSTTELDQLSPDGRITVASRPPAEFFTVGVVADSRGGVWSAVEDDPLESLDVSATTVHAAAFQRRWNGDSLSGGDRQIPFCTSSGQSCSKLPVLTAA